MGRKPKTRRDSYGAWLLHLRTERKFSQDQLAEMTGVPRTNLAYWERTGNLPGREITIKMARALGVSVTKLLRVDKAAAEAMKGVRKGVERERGQF